MPSGKTHERINLILLIPTITALGYYYLKSFAPGLFVLWWFVHTYYFTPDLDTKSKPRKRLWVLGWIIDMIFGHRKTLHNPLFWGAIFAVEYHFIGAWTLGGIIPIASHLITDKF